MEKYIDDMIKGTQQSITEAIKTNLDIQIDQIKSEDQINSHFNTLISSLLTDPTRLKLSPFRKNRLPKTK